MTDPAIEAAQRAWAERYSDRLQPVTYSAQHDGMGALAIAAAREALKPIREEFSHLQRLASDVGPSDLGRGLQHVLDAIAPLIYTTEELER